MRKLASQDTQHDGSMHSRSHRQQHQFARAGIMAPFLKQNISRACFISENLKIQAFFFFFYFVCARQMGPHGLKRSQRDRVNLVYERVGPRIISIESVAYFETSEYFSGRK